MTPESKDSIDSFVEQIRNHLYDLADKDYYGNICFEPTVAAGVVTGAFIQHRRRFAISSHKRVNGVTAK